MANKIFIEEVLPTESKTINLDAGLSGNNSYIPPAPQIFPLMSPITIEIISAFETLSGMVPMLDKISDVMVTLASVTGQASTGTLNFQNMLDVPRWTKTQPIKLVTELHFFAQENAVDDVVRKMHDLINFSIPSYDQNSNTFFLPGINLSNISQTKIQTKENEKLPIKKGKFVSVNIPGIIYLPVAIMMKAMPTFSNEVTESGSPLWGKLDIEIQGVSPATSLDLDRVRGLLKTNQNNKNFI